MSDPATRAEPFRSGWGPGGASATPGWLGRTALVAERAGGTLLILIVAILFAATLAYSFPGLMSNDSVNQYAEALSGRYTDWHPPVMAWLWSKLHAFGDGPAPLFFLHLAGYWSGIGLLADATRRSGKPRTALLLALAGAFPTFVFLNATVTKDVGMVAAWLPAAGLLFWFRAQQRRVPVAVAVLVALLLAYGTLVRGNALFGLGPLLLYAAASPAWLRSGRLLVATVVLAVLAVPVTQQANRILFHPAERDPVHSLFLFDLAGIAAHAQDPAVLDGRAQLDARELAQCYTPYWWDSFSPWGACAATVNRPDTDHATRGDGLALQWLRAIAAHPVAYAQHRLKHFNSELMFAVPLKHIRLTPEYRNVNPDFKPLETVTPRDVRFDLVRKNPSVWPVTWVAWALVMLAFLWRAAPSPAVLAARVLVVSALGYSLAYVVIGVATDIRYYYWAILATVMASLLVLPELGAGVRGRSRPLLAGVAAVALVVAAGLAARLLDFQSWSF